MKSITRRSFLVHSAAAGLSATAFRSAARASASSAGGAIGVAVIGLGIKGLGHLRQLVKRNDVRVAALCDVDPERIARALEELKDTPAKPFTSTDAREVLARKEVDAVMIATGNQWHALLSVWACQAGKDVYVEKPMTHTVWEGRKMIEAAAKYRRVVQVGTQYRSEGGLGEGLAWLHAGNLGKITHVNCLYFGQRGAIGRRLPWYPAGLDYDRFCGPAPVAPLERNKLHYDWHWSWDTGNGDLGNNGVHMLDAALRVVKSTALPRRVLGLGGRFVIDDVAETPNSQIAVYDYPAFPVIFEHRALPAKPGANYMDSIRGRRGGLIVNCEGGYIAGLTGTIAYDPSGKEIRKFAGDGGGLAHLSNFLDAVRSRRTRDLAAPVEVGHASAALCHLGNISYRLGRHARPEQIVRSVEAMPAAVETCRGLQEHLGVHGVDLEKNRLTLGPWLEIDAPKEDIAAVEFGGEAALARGRYLLREAQRPPYAIPEKV